MESENNVTYLHQRKIDVDKLNTTKVASLTSKDQIWSTHIETQPDSNEHGGTGNQNSATNKTGDSNDEDTINTSTTIIAAASSSLAQTTRPELSTQTSRKISLKEMFLSWRYVIVIILHFSFVVAIQVRNCMTMAMICMIEPISLETLSVAGNVSSTVSLVGWNDSLDINNMTGKQYEFTWDTELQGLILTSVSFLSFLGPLVVDVMRRYIGNKWTMTLMSIATGGLNLLVPWVTRISPFLLIALRSLLGVVILANLPIVGDTCAWWVPREEKQLMVTMVFAGINIGGITSSSVAGLLCEIPIDNGWPFVFYCFGGLTLLWTLAWFFLVTQKPEKHPFISKKELEYIITNRTGMDMKKDVKAMKPPYRTILTSVPVLAFLFCGSCHLWSSTLFFVNVPFFFTTALGSSVIETGILMSGVSAARFLGLFVWTAIINALTRSKRFSTTAVKKMTICCGFGVASLLQICVIFFEKEDKWIIIGLLVLIMLHQCVGSSVVPVVPLDMAPRYAGFLTGLFFSFGTLASVSAPLIVAAFTPTGSLEEWRHVWILTSVVYLFAALVFGIFGDASLQPWALDDKNVNIRVVSPWVTMGRRLSALFHFSPLPTDSTLQDASLEVNQFVSPVHQIHMNGQLSYGDQSRSMSVVDSYQHMPPVNNCVSDVDIALSHMDKDVLHDESISVHIIGHNGTSPNTNGLEAVKVNDIQPIDSEIYRINENNQRQGVNYGECVNQACESDDDGEAQIAISVSLAVSELSLVTRM